MFDAFHALLVALVATVPPPDDTGSGTAIERAVAACEVAYPDTYELYDLGQSVVATALDFQPYECIRSELGLPEWTRAVMGYTNPADGLMSVDIGRYALLWSWHPDAPEGALFVIYDREAEWRTEASERFAAIAENLIESDGFSSSVGVPTYADARCDAPPSASVGTEFQCTAVDAQDTRWRFTAVILGDTHLEVLVPPEPV